MSDKDFNEYLAWLEQQTWVWQQEEGVLVLFDPEQGPREFVETARGEWTEMDNGEFIDRVEDLQLITLLNAKMKELQPQ